MSMSKEDYFKAALRMIQVTPNDYKNLTAEMITHVCRIVVDAEKLCEASTYEGLTAGRIKERLIP